MKTKQIILRPKEVSEMLGISKPTIWRLEKAGDFPIKIQLGASMTGYLASDIEEWIASRVPDGERERVKYSVKQSLGAGKYNSEEIPECLNCIPGVIRMPLSVCRSCVYFLVKDGQLLYIGQSKKPLRRISSHSEKVSFDDIFILYADIKNLNAIEGALIRKLNPLLNIHHGPGCTQSDIEYLNRIGFNKTPSIEPGL